jgi:hypothetical protein
MGTKLLTVGMVVNPLASSCYLLTRRNRGRLTYNRYKIAMTARLDRNTQKPLSLL